MQQALETPVEVKLESILEDFEPGDRVAWNGCRWFGTVSHIAYGKLFIAYDPWQGELLEVATAGGNGNSPAESFIAQWRVFPNIDLIKVGDVISSNMWSYADPTRAKRVHFVITGIEPGKRVFLENIGDPKDKLTLQGDNFSRNLEDAIYEWEIEG